MIKIEFVDYVLTPGEKHLGVATINFNDQLYLRYKVQPGKDGKGHFFSPASHKMPGDTYVPSFVIDSNFVKEKISTVIKNGISTSSVFKPNKQVLDDHEEIPF